MTRLLLVCLLACTGATLTAQDFHFTLHDYAPLWLNPAQTGAFSGSIRASGNFRAQADGFSLYRTPGGSIDAPVIKGFTAGDWIGAGAVVISDNAGFGVGDRTTAIGGTDRFGLTQTFFGFSGSYHLALDKNRRNVVTLGAQYGSTSFDINANGTPNQEEVIPETLGGQGQGQGETFRGGNQMGGGGIGGGGGNNNFNSLNAGLMLRSVLDDKKDNLLEVGFSLLHIAGGDRQSLIQRGVTSPDSMMIDTTLGTSRPEDRERRPTFHGHARMDIEINDNYRFQPTAFFQSSASTSSLSIQAWGARNLKPDVDLRAGLGLRTGDAIKFMAGLDYKNIRAALSYDVITLAGDGIPTTYTGALEVGVNYIFNIYKKPDVTPTMLCPRI